MPLVKTLPGREYFCLRGFFPDQEGEDSRKSWNSIDIPGQEEFNSGDLPGLLAVVTGITHPHFELRIVYYDYK